MNTRARYVLVLVFLLGLLVLLTLVHADGLLSFNCVAGTEYTLIIQVTVFAFLLFPLATLQQPLKSAASYTYIGAILVCANLLGSVYSFRITESVRLSGGNLAYSALMMTTASRRC